VPDRVRRHLWFSGRVQGVFFRDHCRALAQAQGVAGTAVNRPDGRVEVVLEGRPDAVAAVEAACRAGPHRARVDHVDARDEAPAGLTGFTVA
jgi:acylphosphatase